MTVFINKKYFQEVFDKNKLKCEVELTSSDDQEVILNKNGGGQSEDQEAEENKFLIEQRTSSKNSRASSQKNSKSSNKSSSTHKDSVGSAEEDLKNKMQLLPVPAEKSFDYREEAKTFA